MIFQYNLQNIDIEFKINYVVKLIKIEFLVKIYHKIFQLKNYFFKSPYKIKNIISNA